MPQKKTKSGFNKRNDGGLLSYPQKQFCPQPYQDEQFVTFRYLAQVDTTASVGIYSYGFRMNSPYDPDYTFTGVQPVGFDEWAAIYSKYVVYSCDVRVIATSRTSLGTLDVGMLATVDTNIPLMEAAYGSRRGCQGSTTGGASPLVLRKNFPINEIFGVSKASIDIDDAYAAQLQGGNPARPAYLWVVINTSGASDAFSLSVQLKMRTKLWLPNLVTVSLPRVRPSLRVAGAAPTPSEHPKVLPASDPVSDTQNVPHTDLGELCSRISALTALLAATSPGTLTLGAPPQ